MLFFFFPFPIHRVDTILKWTLSDNILIKSQNVLEQLVHSNDGYDLKPSGDQS